jgi:lysozyme family protein
MPYKGRTCRRCPLDAYATQDGDALKLAAFEWQVIATALLSFAVVEGQRQAVKLLQQVVGHNLVCDGVVGDMTVDAANSIDPNTPLNEQVAAEERCFASLEAVNASQQRFLHGGDNRAEALKVLLRPETTVG